MKAARFKLLGVLLAFALILGWGAAGYATDYDAYDGWVLEDYMEDYTISQEVEVDYYALDGRQMSMETYTMICSSKAPQTVVDHYAYDGMSEDMLVIQMACIG